MPISPDPKREERANSYPIESRHYDKEILRLTFQDRIITEGMGGVLPEQADPTLFQSIADVGCGTGGWLIEAAKTYPTMTRLVGIDINQHLAAHARTQAEAAQVAGRVEFRIMDALRMLEFPNNTFDLTNARFNASYMRTWEWPKLVTEMIRITRRGGVVRLTEPETTWQNNSPALTQLGDMILCAFYKSGHLFTNESAGVMNHLAEQLFMRGYGCEDIQTKSYALEYQAGTPQGEGFLEDMKYIFLVIRPFLEKMGCASKNYENIYQQALVEMQQPDFHATWNILTAWGSKPKAKVKASSNTV